MRLFFPGQQESEEVYLIVREHWFFLFLRIAVWTIFAAILVLIKNYLPDYLPGLFREPYLVYFRIFQNIYLLFLTLGLFLLWTLYYLNVQMITNKRVVDVTQGTIFQQKISELLLPNIEDVTSEVKGFFGTVLDYGNVLIQTAGEQENFRFDRVPNPREIAKLIDDLLEKSGQNNV